ncbi:MAG: tetratricopeptide repeat protein [Thermodesulfobacteriota bacterium]
MKKFLPVLLAWLTLLACGSMEGSPPDPGKEAQKWLYQGMKQFQQQEFDLALSSFKKAIELEPKSAAAYNMLGMTYRFKYNQVRRQELKEKEIAAFTKALEIDPNFGVALINLGATYYYLGEKAKAAPLFKKALLLYPYHQERAQLEKMIAEGEGQP